MTDVLVSEPLVAEPLVICDYQNPDHPTGKYGCFRCIDEELLEKLLSMASENKVKVFSVSVTAPTKVNSEEFLDFYMKIIYVLKYSLVNIILLKNLKVSKNLKLYLV